MPGEFDPFSLIDAATGSLGSDIQAATSLGLDAIAQGSAAAATSPPHTAPVQSVPFPVSLPKPGPPAAPAPATPVAAPATPKPSGFLSSWSWPAKIAAGAGLIAVGLFSFAALSPPKTKVFPSSTT